MKPKRKYIKEKVNINTTRAYSKLLGKSLIKFYRCKHKYIKFLYKKKHFSLFYYRFSPFFGVGDKIMEIVF